MSAKKVHDAVTAPEVKPDTEPLQSSRGESEVISVVPAQASGDDVERDPAKAIEHWRGVLRQDPSNLDARPALIRLYRGVENWNALLDVLRSEAEALPAERAGEKLSLLREMADVYEAHVRNDLALASVLSQIAVLDPGDVDAVRALVKLYESLSRWRDLLSAQAKLAELELDPSVKADLYRSIAERWLDQFSNVQNAVDAYERLHRSVPEDADAIEKLKQLYTRRRAYKPLYELLVEEAAAMDSGPSRRAAWLEMAKLASERLDRGADAIRLYELILEEEPSDKTVLDALEKQAEREKDYVTLARILERRVGQSTDVTEQVGWLQKLGALYAERLDDRARSLGAWRRILELQPTHAKALRVLRDSLVTMGDYESLTELYSSRDDWEGLAEVFSNAADKANEDQVKVDLSYRAAAIYHQQLNFPDRALKNYERILNVRPDDMRAVIELVPLLEREHKWAQLPKLYEILLREMTSPDEQLPLLNKLVEVNGQRLHDHAAAFAFAERAYVLVPESSDTFSGFELAAKTSGNWEAFATALAARSAQGECEPIERRALLEKLATVYAGELGRTDDAVILYRQLIEEDESNEVAIHHLDHLLRATDRRDDLRWLFEFRAKSAGDDERVRLLEEWAVLEEEVFGAPSRATALYRQILEVDSEHRAALRALVRLLKTAGDMRGAALVLERACEVVEGTERLTNQLELARIYLDPLGRASDAFETCRRVLDVLPNEPSAISILEKLLEYPEARAASANLLEAFYAFSGKAARQAEMLEVQISSAAADARLELLLRLVDVQEHKLHNPDATFEVTMRAAKGFPDELSLWERLMALAGRPARAQALADAITALLPPSGDTSLSPEMEVEFARYAVTLFNEKLGQIDRAVPYLERILARDSEDASAFELLKQILTTRERWHELERLYEQRLQFVDDSSQKAGYLLEMAVIAADITGDHAKAIDYYERVLAIDPSLENAVRALDRLYTIEERWDALAALIERRLEVAGDTEAIDLRLRLGGLVLSRLKDPTRAFDLLTQVLESVPDHPLAREHVESLLTVSSVRAEAAVVLERAYTMTDDFAELSRILAVHLEFAATDDERSNLYRRIAELCRERLHEDGGAFEAFAQLVPLDWRDEQARTMLLALGRKLGKHAQVVDVLTSAAKAASSPSPRVEILVELAKFCEDPMRDTAGSERVYREVLEIEAADHALLLDVARSLGKIYSNSQRYPELAELIRLELKLEDDDQARRELYARLGELTETVLADPKGAIAVWKTRLSEEPEDQAALLALDRLYDHVGDPTALVEILQTRERVEDDPATRRTLLLRLASLFAKPLGDVSEAVRVYRAVLDDYGADQETFFALEAILESDARWTELAETIDTHLAIVEATPEQNELLARLGSIRFTHLADPSGAIEAYKHALMLDPSHVASRTALERMLSDERAALDAAAILGPLYEADGDAPRFLTTLNVEVESLTLPSERLPLLERAVLVAEMNLNDPQKAFTYALRGLRESAQEDEFPAWLSRTDRLAAATGRPLDMFNQLKEILSEVRDPDREFTIAVKLAELANTKLMDKEVSRDFYLKALDLRPEDDESLAALELIYQEIGNPPTLLEIVKRRTELAIDADRRKDLLRKQADLYEHALRDEGGAIAAFEQLLELGSDDPTVAALIRLYTKTQRWVDLVALYERLLGEASEAERKADLHYSLGETLQVHVSDLERAFEEYENALKRVPHHEATVRALEAFLTGGAHVVEAASLLEPLYVERSDWPKVVATIEARLAATSDAIDRRPLLERLSDILEHRQQDPRGALEAMAKLFADDATDERVTSELERLAQVAQANVRLAEIYSTALESITPDEPATARLAQRTGQLLEQQGELDRALAFYKRAYSFAPSESDESFVAIDRLLKRASRPLERVSLYRDSLSYRDDPERRLTALHTIAQIQAGELVDEEGAIATHRAAVECDDRDHHSLDALTALFTKLGRWKDLAELLRHRASRSQHAEEEATFRLTLGKLLERQFGDGQAAMDEYQAILELGPVGSSLRSGAVEGLEGLLHTSEYKARAVEILGPIYEMGDDWQHVINLNQERLALTEDRLERASILRETARLWESRGADPLHAFQAIQKAFALDPDDGETRSELDRLALKTEGWDELAATYESATANAEGTTLRELIQAVATLHDARRGDLNAALQSWERLFHLDETDPEPLDAMIELALLLGRWVNLAQLLSKHAELASSESARAASWRRIGDIRQDTLLDDAGAIEAYEHSLEIEATNVHVLDRLIALHEAKGDSTRLVDLYRRRGELCGEDEEDKRYDLLVAGAACYENGLGDKGEAIHLLTEALELRPNDRACVLKLEGLYTQEKLWPDLLENLRTQVQLAESPQAALEFKKRIGGLLAGPLEDAPQALVAYREVIEGGPFDEATAAAVRDLGERFDDLRLDVATILEPVFRAEGRHADVADVLELRLRDTGEPQERAAILNTLAGIYEVSLRDIVRAEDALLRALVEQPNESTFHEQIERLANAAASSEAWRRYADVLAERTEKILDSTVVADLLMRLGRVAAEHLNEPDRAVRAYAEALERGGDNLPALEALHRLYAQMREHRSLADVIGREIAITSAPEAKVALYARLGALQQNELEDRAGAVVTYREALNTMPDHAESRRALEQFLDDDALFDEAFEVLDGVYRALGLGHDLAKLFERRIPRAGGVEDRTRARLAWARVIEKESGDSAGAQRAIEQALSEAPNDTECVDELDRLAGLTGQWSDATRALSLAVEKAEETNSAGNLAELWIRLATWQRDRLVDKTAAELAFRKALACEPENVEIVRSLEGLLRQTDRRSDLVALLRRRATLEGDSESKRALLREAMTLAYDDLHDFELVEAILRELLAENDADLWALEQMSRLREAQDNYDEQVVLLLRRAELADKDEDARQLKHRAASLLTEKLGDRSRAIAIYEELLEGLPGDEQAIKQLRLFYLEADRGRDLAKLLGRLIETERRKEGRSALRLELARLEDEKLGASRDAVDTLRALLEDDPGSAEAIVALSQLLEKNGQDEELAELLNAQIERARDNNEVNAELTLQVRLGEVFAGRLKDIPRALATYEAVLARSPSHQGALEAVANLSEQRGTWDRAAEALSKLLEMTAGAQRVGFALRLASASDLLGDVDSCEKALKRAHTEAPNDPEVRARLEALYEKNQRWSALAQLLIASADSIAVETANADAAPIYTLGSSIPPPPLDPAVAEKVRLLRRAAELYVKQLDAPADAVPALEKAVALAPYDRELFLALADAYTTCGRQRDAASMLEKVIASFGTKRTKELSFYHHRLGRVFSSLGDQAGAINQFEVAFKINPSSLAILKDLAMYVYESGDLDKAQKSFRALLVHKFDPTSEISKADVFFYLGEISAKQGDKTKAQQMFERAVENEPTHPRAKARLVELKG